MDFLNKENNINNKLEQLVFILLLKISQLYNFKLNHNNNLKFKLLLKLNHNNNKYQNNKNYINNLKLKLKYLLDQLLLMKMSLLMLMDNLLINKNMEFICQPNQLFPPKLVFYLSNTSKSINQITMILECMFWLVITMDTILLPDNLILFLDLLELMP